MNRSDYAGPEIRQPSPRLNQQPTSTGRQPLLWAALAFAAGIVTGVNASRPPLWWLLAWILLTLSAAYLLRRRGRSAFLLGLGALFILGALMDQVRVPGDSGDFAALALSDGSEVMVTAHVIKEGPLQQDRPGEIRQRLDVETEQIVRGTQTFQARSGLRVSIYDQQRKREATQEIGPDIGQKADVSSARLFHYGERLHFPAKLSLPRNFRNPGAFDYRSYLMENGIVALASIKSASVEVLPGFTGSRIEFCAHESIAASSKKYMPYSRRAKRR